MELIFYENLAENIKNEDWDVVWGDSFFAKQGQKIRKYLEYDGESASPCSKRDEELLRFIGLTLIGDYVCGEFS